MCLYSSAMGAWAILSILHLNYSEQWIKYFACSTIEELVYEVLVEKSMTETGFFS